MFKLGVYSDKLLAIATWNKRFVRKMVPNRVGNFSLIKNS